MPHDHFDRLLVVLIALFVVTGLGDSAVNRLLAAVLYLVAVGLAIHTTGARGFRWAPKLMALGLVALAAVVLAPFGHSVARGWGAVCTGLVSVGALLAVAGRIMRHERVGRQTIAGALCAYLLIGSAFSSAYGAIDNFGSEPAFGEEVTPAEYSYFSFITLTTTGYGDLTPVSDVARRFAVLEAMAGQLFLAITVARLVTLYRPERPGSRPPDRTEAP